MSPEDLDTQTQGVDGRDGPCELHEGRGASPPLKHFILLQLFWLLILLDTLQTCKEIHHEWRE